MPHQAETLDDMYANGIDVWIQDQTTSPFQYYLMREDKIDIALTSSAAINDTVVNVSAGHGFTATGEYIVIYEGDSYMQSKVKSVATNAITISSPLANAFTTNAVVIRGSIEMNIDGSTPVDFKFTPRGGAVTPIDIQFVKITMINTIEPDDSKFGNLAELTNGLLFRQENDVINNYGNFTKNADFKEFGADVEYSDKAGGGAFSTTVTFDIKKVFGIVVRINPSLLDVFLAKVRDNVSTLTQLRVSLLGQYTLGEV